MRIGDLKHAELSRRLKRDGLCFGMGPFNVSLRSDPRGFEPLLTRLHGLYPLYDDLPFKDFHVRLRRCRGLRRWARPQVQFLVDGEAPFAPFPEDTALPFLEWGLNWCVATRSHQYLMLHAGVVEKGGRAVVLPAWPGSGKSTLCAALMHRGWRLLSDEFGLVRPADAALVPLPRLISLKNASIGVIRDYAPEAVLGPEFPKTRKGTVAHLRPTEQSVARAGELARPGLIVFPRFQAGASLSLQPLPRERAFLKLSGNAFNYELIGLRGFEAVSRLIETCPSYLFRYGDLDEAVAALDALMADTFPGEESGVSSLDGVDHVRAAVGAGA